MKITETTRDVIFVLLGVVILVLKPYYKGPFVEIFYSYGGNFAVSFAVYFLAIIAVSRRRFGRLTAAAMALLAVEAFEATNGFGVMSNVYDPIDFLANAIGIGFAVVIDIISSRIKK